VLSAYGEAGAVPLFLLIAVHLPLMMVAATVMIEGGEAGLSAPALRRFGWNMVTNPILIAFFLGLVARMAGVSLGGVPKTVIDMISASAVPCALFALGLALHRYGIAGDLTLSVVITALKLMLLRSSAAGTPRFQLARPCRRAVIFAAMPCG
jgi:predicted permease